MSKNDFRLAKPGLSDPEIVTFAVKSGTTASILSGEPVITNSAAVGYVKLPGANITSGGSVTDAFVVGVAMTNSDESTSADGVVSVAVARGNIKFVGKAGNTFAQAQETTNVAVAKNSGVFTLDNGTTTTGVATLLDYNSTSNEFIFAFKDGSVLGA